MRFSLFLVMVLYVSMVVAQQNPSSCAPNRGLCRTNADCCSRSCFTYTSRCSGQVINAPVRVPDYFQYTSQQIQQIQQYASRPRNPASSTSASNSRQELINSLFVDTSSFQQQQPSLENRFDGNSNGNNAVTRPNTGGSQTSQCKSIGVKCYKASECCSTRCQGFLHQCVH